MRITISNAKEPPEWEVSKTANSVNRSSKFEGEAEIQEPCLSDAPAKPFLTLPSHCQLQQPFTITTDSWESPGQFQTFSPEPEIATTGCEQLAFTPSLTLVPETTQADTPSGYTVELHVPQNEAPHGLAAPDLRKAVVSLPEGVVVSPSAANGLQGCSQEQFELRVLAAASCPLQSQIGTVKITTPLLSSPLEGHVFLAEPECAPCTPAQAQEGKLLRLLLQAQGSGVTVKLEGAASIDQSTGQLTVTFQESPAVAVRSNEADAQRWRAGAASEHIHVRCAAGGQFLAYALQQRNVGAAIK